MPNMYDLMQSEIDAINLYSEFLKEHHKELTSKDIKRIRAIINDERDHNRIDREIFREHIK